MNNTNTTMKNEQNLDSTSSTNTTRSSTRNIIDQRSDNYNNNYIAHGTPRVPLDPSQLERIREAYADNIGPMTGAVARLIETAIDHGLTVPEVLDAIEETGMAPRPSAYYLRAILEQWAASGVTTSRIRHEQHRNRAVKWWKDDGRW